MMLQSVPFLCALLATTIALAVSIALYPNRCEALERHLATNCPDCTTGGFAIWQEKCRSLDRARSHTAICIMFTYAAGVIALRVYSWSTWGDISTGVASPEVRAVLAMLLIGLLAVGLRSTTHESRKTKLNFNQKFPYSA